MSATTWSTTQARGMGPYYHHIHGLRWPNLLNCTKEEALMLVASMQRSAVDPTLLVLIERLKQEQIQIASELNSMEPDAWLNVQGSALVFREQELHTTLRVLCGLVQQPLQIEESAL